MKNYGYIPLACGKTEDIYNLQNAVEKCVPLIYEVEDVKDKGISALYAAITNPDADEFEKHFRPSLVYIVRTFIDRYGLSVDGGEYEGYVEPDPKNLASPSQKSIDELIKYKKIDEVFGKTTSDKSMQ